MLGGTDGFKFIEVHDEIVCQCHLLVELVREVQVVEIILTHLRRKQPSHEGGLTTALGSDEGRHTLIAVKHVQLEPMGCHRTEPDGKEGMLFGTEAGQTAEQTGHMVLTVPLGQTVEEHLDGIEDRNLVGLKKLRDLRLRTALFQHMLPLGVDDNTVQRLLGQRLELDG